MDNIIERYTQTDDEEDDKDGDAYHQVFILMIERRTFIDEMRVGRKSGGINMKILQTIVIKLVY